MMGPLVLHCFQCKTLPRFSSLGGDWWRNVMLVNCSPSACSIGCLQQQQDVYVRTLFSEKMRSVASLNWSRISRKGLLVTSWSLAAQVFTRGQMDYWPFFSLHLFPSSDAALLFPPGDVVPSPFLSASLSLPIWSSVELFFWWCHWLCGWRTYNLVKSLQSSCLISHVTGSSHKIALLKFCSPLPAEPGKLSGMCLMWTVTRLSCSNLCSAAVWIFNICRHV